MRSLCVLLLLALLAATSAQPAEYGGAIPSDDTDGDGCPLVALPRNKDKPVGAFYLFFYARKFVNERRGAMYMFFSFFGNGMGVVASVLGGSDLFAQFHVALRLLCEYDKMLDSAIRTVSADPGLCWLDSRALAPDVLSCADTLANLLEFAPRGNSTVGEILDEAGKSYVASARQGGTSDEMKTRADALDKVVWGQLWRCVDYRKMFDDAALKALKGGLFD